MQLNIILNDRDSSTGKVMKTVEYFKTFKIYGERFYIHRLHKKSEVDMSTYITSHEIGLSMYETKALSIEVTFNRTKYYLYKIRGKIELLKAIKDSKEMLHKLVVKKLKGNRNEI